MKIATFNVNGISSRLPALLEWLARESPDIACLQELKAPDNRFPAQALRQIGYGCIWHGQTGWNGVAILAKGAQPKEIRRGLPGDADDTHSRYLEAEIEGLVVGCLYLPNGNPQPGPKFDYKLAWFERFNRHAQQLFDSGRAVVLAGDYNVVHTDFDIYDPKSWRKDALLQPESRDAYARLLAQGWTDALRTRHPEERIYTFWDYFRNHWARNGGLRIDHVLLSQSLAPHLVDANVDRWVRGVPHASDHAPTWVELEARLAAKERTPAKKEPAVSRRVAAGKRAVAGKPAAAKKRGAAKGRALAEARAPAKGRALTREQDPVKKRVARKKSPRR